MPMQGGDIRTEEEHSRLEAASQPQNWDCATLTLRIALVSASTRLRVDEAEQGSPR
jgi:hypothetical protein